MIALKDLLHVVPLLAELCLCGNAVPFSHPVGPYNTSIITSELVDRHRLDPYAPSIQPRALMISVFHPVSSAMCDLYQEPYMDLVTAAFEDSKYADVGVLPGAVESLTLETCQRRLNRHQNPNPLVRASTYPLILFSPGMGNTRLIYNAMAQQ
jgi:hypothetical protein